MAHVEDRWTRPTGQVDKRRKPIREHTARYGRGRRYVAMWTEQGQRKSKSFDTKDAANAHLGEIARAKREGTHVLTHKLTVAEYGEQWIDTHIHQRGSTRDQMQHKWVYIRRDLGDLPLREVTRAHVQNAVTKWLRDDQMAPSTIHVTYGYVSGLFKAAIIDRLLGSTPCVKIKLPEVVTDKVIPLATDQVHHIADTITHRYRGLILLGAASGMRSGELRGLTVNRVTWAGDIATIRVDRQLTNHIGPTWGPPKTRRSDRIITLDPQSSRIIPEHMEQHPPHETGLLFTGRNGGPLARTSLRTAWKNAAAGMGLPHRDGPHMLRHYHASLLIAAGLSVTAVADRLGHQDPTETLRTYAHLWPNDEERSRKAIADGLWVSGA